MSSTQGSALPLAGEEIDILIQCSGHFSNPFFSSWTHVWLLGDRDGGGFSHKTHLTKGKRHLVPLQTRGRPISLRDSRGLLRTAPPGQAKRLQASVDRCNSSWAGWGWQGGGVGVTT